MSIKVMSIAWESSTQSGSNLLVLLAIADYANDDGYAWPSVSSIAKKARISERQTQRTIKMLADNGEIEITQKARPQKTNKGIQFTNLYKVVTSTSPLSEKVVTSRVEGGDIAVSPYPYDPSLIESSGGNSMQQSCTGNPSPTPPQAGPSSPPDSKGLQDDAGAVHGCRDKGKAVKASPAGKEPWMQAYAEEWEKATRGGAMPIRQVVKGFSRAESAWGRPAVIEAWRKYCRVTQAEFLSPHSFLSKIGVWIPQSSVATEKGRDAYFTKDDKKRILGL